MPLLCIAVTCGLPGAGKSSLVAHLVAAYATRDTSVLALDLDAVHRRLLTHRNNVADVACGDDRAFDSVIWQRTRARCERAVRALVESLSITRHRCGEQHDDDDDDDVHHDNNNHDDEDDATNDMIDASNARRIFDSVVPNGDDDDDGTMMLGEYFGFHRTNDDNRPLARRVLVLIDDNMYYKSMRRDYYNLARQCRRFCLRFFLVLLSTFDDDRCRRCATVCNSLRCDIASAVCSAQRRASN